MPLPSPKPEEARNMWVVGQWIAGPEGRGANWEFQGVFDTEDKAVAACRDEEYFVGPVTLNATLKHESLEWPGCYYPLLEAADAPTDS